MKPDAPELLLGLQQNLLLVVLPHLDDPFVQGQVQSMALLLQALAGEWDAAVPQAKAQNAALEGLLARAAAELDSPSGSGAGETATLAGALRVLASQRVESDYLSDLRSRRQALNQGLQDLLITCERLAVRDADAGLLAIRSEGYRFLRADLELRTGGPPGGRSDAATRD